jgi:threonine/homoserine/homoserine lactone efflux protein
MASSALMSIVVLAVGAVLCAGEAAWTLYRGIVLGIRVLTLSSGQAGCRRRGEVRRHLAGQRLSCQVMISTPTLLLFLLAAGALILMPGPAVLFIVSRSAHQGVRAGFASALGVACGGLVHVAGAVLGFSALLASSAVAFGAVRWLGAAYLIFTGIRILRGGDSPQPAAPLPAPLRRLLWQGFVVNLLNPKTALFFLAFLPQFIDPARGSAAMQMLYLGILFVAMALLSDSLYALLAGSLGGRLGRTARASRNMRWLSGGVHVALGVGTALTGSRSAKA